MYGLTCFITESIAILENMKRTGDKNSNCLKLSYGWTFDNIIIINGITSQRTKTKSLILSILPFHILLIHNKSPKKNKIRIGSVSWPKRIVGEYELGTVSSV
jgi:hypothetical protein